MIGRRATRHDAERMTLGVKLTTTISKLTDAEMVGTDEKGFEGTWLRLKDK